MSRGIPRVAVVALCCLLAPSLPACDGGGADCTAGSESCACLSGEACNPGLHCIGNRCVSVSGADASVDGAAGGSSDAGVSSDAAVDDGVYAFPTAYGGGAHATGGRGGNVYHVTHLLDDGSAGSLRWALAQPRPATILFDASGTIELQSTLNVEGGDLTIAGQSAPVGGITITGGARFKGQDVSNVIIRYIRIRPFESGNDAYEFYGNNDGAYNIIMDHVSVSYGGDENISLRGALTHNVTYQRMLVAEGKTGSLFGDSDISANSYDNSYLNSLFFNVSHRTPNCSSDGRVDIVNNVTHDWQYRLTWARGNVKLNHINNYHSMGSRAGLTDGSTRQVNISEEGYAQEIYTSGNYIDKSQLTDPSADNQAIWVSNLNSYSEAADPAHFVSAQHQLVGRPLQVQAAVDAYSDVINDVGANVSLNADGTESSSLDVQDAFYLGIMAQGEGAFHPYEMSGNDVRTWFDEQMYADFAASVSATPVNTRPQDYYVSSPHIPEMWKQANVPSGEDYNDIAPSGYTYLEEFLNEVDR